MYRYESAVNLDVGRLRYAMALRVLTPDFKLPLTLQFSQLYYAAQVCHPESAAMAFLLGQKGQLSRKTQTHTNTL